MAGQGDGPRIVWTRIDDRLIHGQVVIKWLRRIKHDRVVICDDQVARDAFLENVFQLAMPGSETLLVMSVSEFVRWMATTEESWRVFLLLKTPETASHLLEAGLEMDSLNVGAMGARPDTERVYKSVSLTQEQLALLRSLETRGVNVFFQTVPEPEGKPTPLRTVAGQR